MYVVGTASSQDLSEIPLFTTGRTTPWFKGAPIVEKPWNCQLRKPWSIFPMRPRCNHPVLAFLAPRVEVLEIATNDSGITKFPCFFCKHKIILWHIHNVWLASLDRHIFSFGKSEPWIAIPILGPVIWNVIFMYGKTSYHIINTSSKQKHQKTLLADGALFFKLRDQLGQTPASD